MKTLPKKNGRPSRGRDTARRVVRQRRERHYVHTMCFYCDIDLSEPNNLVLASYDHVQPLSRGGSNDENNIVFSCTNCNREKAILTLDEFLEAREAGTLEEVRRKAEMVRYDEISKMNKSSISATQEIERKIANFEWSRERSDDECKVCGRTLFEHTRIRGWRNFIIDCDGKLCKL